MSSKRKAHEAWFSTFVVISLAGCGEKIGEDPFETITASDSSGGAGTGSDAGTGTSSATSSGTSASTSASTTASTTGMSSADSGGSESGPVDCSTCVPPLPDGWYGPVVLQFGAVGDPPAACEGAYSEQSLTVLSGFHDPGPAECNCECTLQGSFCNSYAYEHNEANCQSYWEYIPLTDGMCVYNMLTFGWLNTYTYQQGNPYCQAMKTENIPEAEWDTLVSSCGLEDPLLCENGDVCVPPAPEGFDGAACIFQEGETECPAGDFTIHKVFYTGVTDDRGCTNCACGQGMGMCGGSVDIFASSDCSGDVLTTAPCSPNGYGMCTVPTGGNSLLLDLMPSGSCPIQTAPMPEGSIAPKGPFTYCCMG